ncbi:MAG: hypothetical protein ACO1QS_03060 [Verrucomicrobiota bacterium]
MKDVLLAKARRMEEMERFDFLWELARSDWLTACYILQRTPVDERHLKALFDMGLVWSNVSSCRQWIETAVIKAGILQTVKWIKRHLESSPLCVHKSFYNLSGVVERMHEDHPGAWLFRKEHGLERLSDLEYERARNAVKDLKECFELRYPKFQTSTSAGSHPDGQKKR